MAVVRRRFVPLALAVTVAAACVTRFGWLGLMEFKGDEANACRLALHVLGFSEPGVGHFFPTAGLRSSIGVPNPPLFVYLMALPLAVSHSPLAAAIFIAAANVVAVSLTYVAVSRVVSSRAGLIAAALLALSPWGIIFSRKIWAQDLLPLCTVLFLLELHALLIKREARSPFWLIMIATAASQLHFSGWVLVAITILALILARSWLSLRWVGWGLAVAALAYVPYLALHFSSAAHALAHQHGHHPPLATRFELSLHYTLDIAGGGGLHLLLGHDSATGDILAYVVGIAGLLGLALAAPRWPRMAVVLGAWYLLPLALLTVLPVHPYIHYFIILEPLPYIGVALLLERFRFAPVAVVALLACFAIVDAGFFSTIVRDRGAPGDYGVAYRYKLEAVRWILQRNPNANIRITTPGQPAEVARAYRFLIWDAQLDRRVGRGAPAVSYTLVARFGRPRPAGEHFGPLSVRAGSLPQRQAAER